MSFLTHLECASCGAILSADVPRNTCACGGMLLARYDWTPIRRSVTQETLRVGPASLWRYAPFLPATHSEGAVTLGEGWTPLYRAHNLERALGCNALFIKNEGANPTGTFKDRGASVGITRAVELGIRTVILHSSGNAGAAWATYAARASVRCVTVLPVDAQACTLKQCASMGAHLFVLEGPWRAAGAVVAEAARRHGWFNVNTLKEPYRLEGKKTMGYELCEQLGWALPDVIFYPTGGGLGAIAIWKAFGELREMGWVEGRTPRLLVTQYAGCAPIVKAFAEGKDRCEPWETIDIIPGGLRSPDPPGGAAILRLLRETGGAALAVEKEETIAALAEMARHEGLLACPEGATTLAALRRALREGLVGGHERIVLVNTGSGLKYTPVFPEPAPVRVRPGQELRLVPEQG